MTEQPWPTEIAEAQFIALTTYRRSGVAVSTPVWLLIDGEALLVTTMDSTGKAKRLRHTSRVTVAVSDRRGHVTGPAYDGTAELLPGAAAMEVRKRVTKRYGIQGLVMLTVVHAIGSLLSRNAHHPVGIRIVRTSAST